ncbi:MAG TPA: hypothetical protein VFE13_00835, partial [Caulobacteraceae bacterium]|nr:hypothetical protein [Caulobacteraceae bacterium]
QTSQICDGKFSPKLKVSPEAYVASFRRQVNLFVWLGAVFAALNLVLAFLEENPGERIVKFFAVALWLGVAGISLWSRQRLAKAPGPAAPPAAG